MFSAKERLFKGAFDAVGRYFDFSAARWIGRDRARGRIHLVLSETLCAQFAQSRVFDNSVARLCDDTVLTYFLW